MPICFGKVLAICQPSAYVYLDAEILRLTVGLRCQSDHAKHAMYHILTGIERSLNTTVRLSKMFIAHVMKIVLQRGG